MHDQLVSAPVWPVIEALDAQGLPYLRAARCVGELPTVAQRRQALDDLTGRLENTLGLRTASVSGSLHFGVPVYESLGLRRAEAVSHPCADVLLTKGCDLPLRLLAPAAACGADGSARPQ